MEDFSFMDEEASEFVRNSLDSDGRPTSIGIQHWVLIRKVARLSGLSSERFNAIFAKEFTANSERVAAENFSYVDLPEEKKIFVKKLLAAGFDSYSVSAIMCITQDSVALAMI